MDIPKFETLDIPSDIGLYMDDKNNNYIFHDIKNNVFFRILIVDNTLKRFSCMQDGTIINSIVHNDIIENINDYIWKISSDKYNSRYYKLEIIERIRNIEDNLQIKKTLDFLKTNFNNAYLENSID